VTELALLLAIHTSGLLFAIALARASGGTGAGAELHRLGSALTRAADAFLAQEFRLVTLVAGVLASLAFAIYSVLLQPGSGLGGLETGFWAAVGLGIGAASTCLVARIAARLAIRASLKALSAAERSMDRALGVSIRAGGAVGLFAETVSALGIALVFGLLFAMKGGTKLDAAAAGPLAKSIALLLPAYALGVATAALVIQRGGSTYHVSSDVGGDLAGERDAGLEHDDARNPAIVADLVGDHVGVATGRSIDLFLAASVANVTAIVIGQSFFDAARSAGVEALSFVALPIVARAFGVIASAVGVMVVRTDDPENTAHALWRGQVSTAVISTAGVAGSALWLVGEPHWSRFFWAGLLGVAAAAFAGHFARSRVDRRVGPVRELLETLKLAEAPGVTLGLGAGLETAAAPIFAVAVAMTGAWQLGVSTGLPGGGAVAALTAVMMMLASAPFVLALATLAPVADGARGVSSMASSASSADAQRRTARLDDAGFAATSVAQAYLIVAGCVTALLAASAVPLLAARGGSTAASVDIMKPAVAWSGALGLALVLAFAGSATRAGTRGARGVAQEVERQLRGFPKERGLPAIPAEFTPSYRACVELTAKTALSRAALPIALSMAAPLVLGLALRILYRHSDTALPAEALGAFVAVAALAGLGAALSVDGARATLAAARRSLRRGAPSAGFSAALGADAVADVMGNVAGPAALLMVKAIAVVALVVAPFLGT